MLRWFGSMGAALAFGLVCTSPVQAASGLMVRCGEIAGAEVFLDDRLLGNCPGKFTPESGNYRLKIYKGIDDDTEWGYYQDISLHDGDVTAIDATLIRYQTQAYAKRQAQRLANIDDDMVSIEGGCFNMGDVFGDGDENEKPVHRVCVEGFGLAKYEVTQGLWRLVMGSNPANFTACGDDCPVEQVSYDDAQAFLAKLNRQTGRDYRLPTEAEWEYACRSGGKKQRYCGGNSPDTLAWYDDNSGQKTHRVGGKQANGLGLYDMSGNVWEWVEDCYHDNYRGAPTDGSAWKQNLCQVRVLRGGSWYDFPRVLRSADRIRLDSGNRLYGLGFRVARTLTP